MKILTLNSEYIVDGKELWKNGVLLSKDVRDVMGVTKGTWMFYEGVPCVGDMLYVQYGAKYLRTSTITEVEQ